MADFLHPSLQRDIKRFCLRYGLNVSHAYHTPTDFWNDEGAGEQAVFVCLLHQMPFGEALKLVRAARQRFRVSKANRAVENIYDRWEDNRDSKAAQIVFCDNFKSGDGKFNLFEDIRDKLIARGVPKEDVAVIHDFKTDEARKRLFDAVNRGDVRVLMGTTEKLGVGVNVQERLLTAHHLDAPPRPMDFEQRNGRIRGTRKCSNS